MRPLAALLLIGCSGDGSDDTSPTDGTTTDATSATGDTGATVPGTGPVQVRCEVQPDNALRVACDVTLETAGSVELTWAPADGGPERSVSSSQSATEHTLLLWRMRAQTTYDYTVTASGGTASGSFTTGALPSLVDIDVAVTGSSTATEDVLFQMACDGPSAVVVDAEGHPVWYQDLAEGLIDGQHRAQAVNAALDGGVLAIVDNERVRWFQPDGSIRTDVALPKPLHHDLFERDGRIFVVNADVYAVGGEDYVLDGVYVLAESGTVEGEFELRDLVTPSGDPGGSNAYWQNRFPNAIDWSHVNGMYVDEQLSVYLSMHKHDTVVRIVSDPALPAFGQIVWVLEGTPSLSPWPPDYVVTDPSGLTNADGFAGQHHPSLTAQGALMLFDNGGQPGNSRVLELDLDQPSGEARITGVWPLGESCPIQGAAYELGNGNLLATCMDTLTFYEIDRASSQVVRTLRPTCASGNQPNFVILPRGIPISL